jgi:hypothetical protein
MMYRRFTLLLFSVHAVLSCFAGGGDTVQLLHYGAANGLPTDNIYSLLQDKNGYIWFATDNGVVKYNGYTFRVFNINDSITTNDVWKLYNDGQNRIWLHAYSDQFGYIKDDIYRKVNTPLGLKMVKVLAIAEQEKLLYYIHWNGKNLIESVDTQGNAVTVPIPNAYVPIELSSDTSLLAIYNNRSLYRFKMRDGTVVKQKLCEGFTDERLRYSNLSRANSAYLYSFIFHGNEINLYDLHNCSSRTINLATYGVAKDDRIYLLEDKVDSLMLITTRSILTLNPDFSLRRALKINDLLPSASQLAFHFVDNFGNSWFTTDADGAWLRTRSKGIFHATKEMRALINTAYLGSSEDGTSFWLNKRENRIYSTGNHTIKPLTGLFDGVVGITPAGDSSIFMLLATGNGVVTYNLVTGNQSLTFNPAKPYYAQNTYSRQGAKDSLHLITPRALGFLMQNITALHTTISKGGNRVFMAAGTSLRYITEQTDRYTESILSSERYTNIFYDSINDLYWCYKKEGIMVFAPRTMKKISFSKELLDLLQAQIITGIKADKFNNLYITTNNRIAIFNTRLMQLRYLHTNVDLTDAYFEIFYHPTSSTTKLLLSGKFGIAIADVRGPLRFSHFKIAGNIKNYYYSRIFKMTVHNSGNVVLNTDKDVYSLNIDEFYRDSSLFTVNDPYFMKLVVSTPDQRAIHTGDTLNLTQDAQKINFDLINFYGNGSRKFWYKIDGLEEWTQTETGEVFFADLKPARHYKMQCFVTDDVWISNTYSFTIYKAPYWWQDTIGRTIIWILGSIAFVFLILSIILTTRYFVARSNEKKRAIIELELRALYAQINPHFIFNTLGTALYFISKKMFDEAYLHVNKFSRLLRAYLKSSQERYISLAEEIQMLRNYIELQQIRFEEKFEYTTTSC